MDAIVIGALVVLFGVVLVGFVIWFLSKNDDEEDYVEYEEEFEYDDELVPPISSISSTVGSVNRTNTESAPYTYLPFVPTVVAIPEQFLSPSGLEDSGDVDKSQYQEDSVPTSEGATILNGNSDSSSFGEGGSSSSGFGEGGSSSGSFGDGGSQSSDFESSSSDSSSTSSGTDN